MGTEELRTARLSLRRPVQADVDAIHRIHTDPVACAHNPADLLVSRDDAEQRYQRWNEHWQEHGFGYWTVHGGTGRPLGFCGLKVMRLHGRTVLNLFYRLDPQAWGHGTATEAASAVVGWAAAHQPGHPVVARVRPANVASQKVAGHAGLHRAPQWDTEGKDGLDLIFTSKL